MSATAEKIRRWAEALDTMDYFAVLRVPRPGPSETLDVDALRTAFATAANAFHPDRYRGHDEATQKGADVIFRRVNEAFRVLQHPALRTRYLELLAKGTLRVPTDEIAHVSSGRQNAVRPSSNPPAVPAVAGSVESLVTSPAALPFARLADAALASKDLAKAKLQMQLALSKDPTNIPLLKRLEEVSALIQKR